eukprot:TRINITY_DN14047_c0_g1_i1.p1 TRINITY_DN14047_c0_g1~~TRINITY_DN14047_c0_g1_i1.p1  ORF type:complete len:467 (+),score=86.01 TRINITY_DN14047_c0_g1_i1:59-1459(+)
MASSSTQPTLLQSEAQCKSGWRARLGKEMSKLQGMTHTGLASADSTINRLEETSHQSGFTTLLGMLSKSKAAVQRARERIDDHHDSMQQRLEDGELEPSSLLEKAVGADEMACCRALMSLSVKARSSLQPYTSTHAYGRGLREHWKAQQQLKDMHAEAPQVDASHLGRWMQLSAAVYGRLINRGLFLFRSCPSDNFLEAAAEASGCKLLFDGTSTASGTHRPAFAVFSCEQEGTEPTVVVSVRGTSNIKEFITDLVCEPMALASDDDLSAVRADGHAVHVHEGMWHATRKLAKDLEEPLSEILAARPGHKLLLTGHSLGAAVASLLCIHYRPRFGARVSAIAFAAPQTLDLSSAVAAAEQGVTAVVVGSDLVPRLSMRSACELASAAALRAHEQRKGVADSEAPPPLPQDLVALYPAGHLLLLPRGGPATQARVIQQTDLSSIRVCSTMLSNHMQPVYLKSLGVTS